jgi:glycerophosphoryl diester phosphodiesterase
MQTAVKCLIASLTAAALFIADSACFGQGGYDDKRGYQSHRYRDAGPGRREQAQFGPRPYFLVEDMDRGPLRKALTACRDQKIRPTDFSIGHRGAPLQFPEHTLESYVAAARQGAGIVECDVTFTRDRELVCRHSQCDLHTTTNILQVAELAAKCSQPFTPYDPAKNTPASARCCTSDITLAEFRTLQGKMDAANPRAATVEEYVSQDATASWRTDMYSSRGTLLTHAESIKLFEKLGVKMTPELKAPSVKMPYEGDFTQRDYAQKMIDEYKQAGIHPREVRAQSFSLDDVRYWIENEPRFGEQAVYLDSRVYTQAGFQPTLAYFESLGRVGVEIVAPPMFALLTLDSHGRIVPSEYARLARLAGLDIITWTFERTDLRDGAQTGEFYYSSISEAVNKDGDRYLVLDVLAKDVKILGMFSDWPETVSYYANCMGLD